MIGLFCLNVGREDIEDLSRYVNIYNCGFYSFVIYKRINVFYSINFYSYWISVELNNKVFKSSKNLEL